MYAYKRSNRLSVENRVEAKIMIYSYKIHDLECFLKRADPGFRLNYRMKNHLHKFIFQLEKLNVFQQFRII